jgi:hypothetical protein
VITTGIDLASQPKQTALCSIKWSNGCAEIVDWHGGVADQEIVRAIRQSDKVGIDVPLGWPVAFVRAVYRHQKERSWRPAKLLDLRYRATDKFVSEMTKRWPLSVSTDLIGVPALRAAAFVAQLRREDNVHRTGSGKIVEVYPAAALRMWGFTASGYKGPKQSGARFKLVEALRSKTSPWLVAGGAFFDDIARDDNLLDGFIAALISRAAATNMVHAVPRRLRHAARIEGWIALPLGNSLNNLACSRERAC